jgi:rod shape-determining protein MreD
MPDRHPNRTTNRPAVERTGFQSGGRVFGSGVIPVSLALIGVVVANLPISFTGDHVPAPLLGLMPLYYWCLYRPDLMTPAWAFFIGLAEDILAPGAPGVWALSFVVTYAMLDGQREAFAGLSGIGALLGFAAAAVATCGTAYLIVCFLTWRLLPLGPTLGELATTVILFIPAASLLGYLQRHVVGAARNEL